MGRQGRGDKVAYDDRQYTAEQAEFLRACDRYLMAKRAADGRSSFMTATDYLAVLLSLGYERRPRLPPEAQPR